MPVKEENNRSVFYRKLSDGPVEDIDDKDSDMKKMKMKMVVI